MQIEKVLLTDGSSIEVNKVGYMYIGNLANSIGCTIRRCNITIEQFYEALKKIEGGENIIKEIQYAKPKI